MKKTKFKVGDMVRCVDNPDPKNLDDYKGRGHGWELDRVFKIVNIISRGIAWGVDSYGVYITALELAEGPSVELDYEIF